MKDRAARSRRTAILGGALLMACAVAWAIADFHPHFLFTVPYLDLAVTYATGLLLLGAMVLLALGVRGETGMFGSSRFVMTAAIVFGARNLAFQAEGAAIPHTPGAALSASGVLIPTGIVLAAVFAAAIIVVAAARTRSGTATQLEVTLLWAVSGVDVLLTLASFVGSIDVALLLVRVHAELLLPLCLGLLGATYLARGIAALSAEPPHASASARAANWPAL